METKHETNEKLERERDELVDILFENGYTNELITSFNEEDRTIFGNPKKFHRGYKMGKVLTEEFDQYTLVPIRFNDEYHNIESEGLLLVDKKEKRIHEVVNMGDRGIHYQGRGKITPLALRVDGSEAMVAYDFTVTAGLTDDIMVKTDSGVFADKYLFRHTDHNIAKVNLREENK